MQSDARNERKACHKIIVDIEKLMYQMDSMINSKSNDQTTQVKIFGEIMDTYLKLPLKLKPIFDHCKKIENIMVKALKNWNKLIFIFKCQITLLING